MEIKIKKKLKLLISNLRRILKVVFFVLGEFYMPTFRNTLFHLHWWCTYEDGTDSVPETSAHKTQTPGIHPKKEYNNS
jgi:hypothetical protein